jgi:mono/diheme cytochrome c family protein
VKLRLSVAVVLTVFVAGCGGSSSSGESTPAAAAGGEKLFSDNCASCHTLAAAGASGKVGPDLDQLRPGPELVATQVTNGGGAMPSFKGKLTDAQIQEVATYASDSAGKG